MQEALEAAVVVGFPLIVRPSFILGAPVRALPPTTGFRRLAAAGLAAGR